MSSVFMLNYIRVYVTQFQFYYCDKRMYLANQQKHVGCNIVVAMS